MYTWYLGLDLGQAADYTALAIIEEPIWVPSDGWRSASALSDEQAQRIRVLRENRRPTGRPDGPPPLWLRRLKRYPLRTSYPQIVADVLRQLGGAQEYRRDVVLAIDGTGVGAPVVDMFNYEHVPCQVAPITITGGDHAKGWHVPKRDLIGALQRALQTERLVIAAQTTETDTLVAELKDYRVKISERGHDSYDARTGQHDDLVLAVALAVWFWSTVNWL